MKAKTLDEKFDAGGDISGHLDWSKARRVNVVEKLNSDDMPQVADRFGEPAK